MLECSAERNIMRQYNNEEKKKSSDSKVLFRETAMSFVEIGYRHFRVSIIYEHYINEYNVGEGDPFGRC